MNYPAFALREASLSEDALSHYPDASEQLVLNAVRTWFRPRCDAVRQGNTGATCSATRGWRSRASTAST